MNLTPKDKEELQILNTRLKNLETKLLSEALKLDEELSRRVANKDDILDDYEIEVELQFYLKENDVPTILSESLKGISKDTSKLLGLEENHNEFRGWENHPMKDEHHSWLYHCLYDHTDFGFQDMVKIGMIWSDIKVWYQYKDLL